MEVSVEDAALLISIVLGTIVGLVISASTISQIIRLQRTPTTWISALPSEGPVEVTGKAGGNTILSPITRTACAVWKIAVQEYIRTRYGAFWMTINNKASKEPFELDDETGTIQIYPSSADLKISYEIMTGNLDAEQNAALDRLGFATSGLFGSNRTLRVIEYLLIPQQQLFVTGKIQQNGGKKTIAFSGDVPFVISDRDKPDRLGGLIRRVVWSVVISVVVVVGLAVIYFAQGR